MRKYLNLLRYSDHYRRGAFDEGFQKLGYTQVSTAERLGEGDVLLIWNRYGGNHERATQVLSDGGQVIVAENCPLGNGFREGVWYSLAKSNIALCGGVFRSFGPERWDNWGIEMHPWVGGSEVVILAQRGIGAPDIRCPDRWAESIKARIGGNARVRHHPGVLPQMIPLLDDLKHTSSVVTWNSAASVQALLAGRAVYYVHPKYALAGAARPFSERHLGPRHSDQDRLEAFRKLAWAMWECDTEIRSGFALEAVLS